MRYLILLVLAAQGSAALGQLHISNHVFAETSGGPNSDSDVVDGFDGWRAHNRVSGVTALSTGIPSVGVNVASASQRFEESMWGDNLLRTRSFVKRASGGGDAPLYQATAQFTSLHRLVVEIPETILGTVSIRLFVPVHGFLAANHEDRGYAEDAEVYVSSSTTVALPGAAPFARTQGDIWLTSSADHAFRWGAHDDWELDGRETDVQVSDGATTETWNGVELSAATFLNAGDFAAGSSVEFEIVSAMDVSARIGEGDGQFALADFTATSGYQFQAFDESGARIYDFAVRPVPEPASLAALALGLAALRRRQSR